MTIRRFISDATAALTPRYGEREAHSIAWIVAEAFGGVTRRDLALDPEAGIAAEGAQQAVERIAAGEPVQYATGRAWFCGMELKVGPGVLIPRPETEELVGWIASQHGGDLAILDIGTGSGAIAIALAGLLPEARVTALDVSSAALAIASENAVAQGVKVNFERLDILSGPVAKTCDIAVSNPPYIPQGESRAMAAHVIRHEPHKALFVPDGDPLLFYRAIVRNVRAKWYYFEVHENYAGQVCAMLRETGLSGVESREDMNGKQRMVRCRKA